MKSSRLSFFIVIMIGFCSLGLSDTAYCIDVCWNCPRDYWCIYEPTMSCVDGACPHGTPCRRWGPGIRVTAPCPKYDVCLLGPHEGASSGLMRSPTESQEEAWVIFSYSQVDLGGRPSDLRVEAASDLDFARAEAASIQPFGDLPLPGRRTLYITFRWPSGAQPLPRLRFTWRIRPFPGILLLASGRVVARVVWKPGEALSLRETDILYSDIPGRLSPWLDFINNNLEIYIASSPWEIRPPMVLFLIFHLPPPDPQSGVGVTGYVLPATGDPDVSMSPPGRCQD